MTNSGLLFVVCALGLATAGAAQPARAPFLVQAEDPSLTHEGGMGNLSGLWAFWSNGSITAPFTVEAAGAYKAAVRAGGTSALDPATGKSLPQLVVEVDGAAHGPFTWEVTQGQGDPGIYATDAFPLEPGAHTLRVSFPNDFGAAGQDRNLFLDWLALGPVASPEALPMLTPEEVLLRAQPTAVAPRFRFAGETLGWQAVRDATLIPTAEGLRVGITGPEPTLLSPLLDAEAASSGVLTLRLGSAKPGAAELRWVVDGVLGSASRSVALPGDGALHVVPVELAGVDEWAGRILGIALRLPGEIGTVWEIASIDLAEAVVGPAEPRIRTLCPDAAINRAGMPATLVASLENVGGSPARQVRLSLLLPGDVRLIEPKPDLTLQSVEGRVVATQAEQTLDTLDGRTEVAWEIEADEPVTGTATLTVSGEGVAPARASCELAFTPRPEAQPALVDGKPYVPAPQRVQADTQVGVYYFPGWRAGATAGWLPIEPFPERKPVLGWYDEGDPSIADWHIKWAAEHGISFFIYDWYWSAGGRSLEHALHEGYLQAHYRSQVKFCLLWANHNPPGSTTREDLRNVTRYWLEHYFLLDEYQKIDGKPVMVIFSPGRIADDLGAEETAAAFAEMNQMCRAAGLPGIYLVGCTWPSEGSLAALAAQGYNAASGYNYPSAGARPEDGNRPPYERALEGYPALWEIAARYGKLDYIPVTDPGWDSRPWAGDGALALTGKDPAKFRRMLALARSYADQHRVGASRARVVFIEAWNEFGEGAAIEPAREFGFGWLDAVRAVFTSAPAEHDDVIPADVGLTVPQWLTTGERTAWGFDTDGRGEGWGPMMGLADFRVEAGALRARSVGTDPAFTCVLAGMGSGIEARRFDRLRIRMSASAEAHGQLFWATTRIGEGERNSVHFTVPGDGAPHELTLDLAGNPTWAGLVTRLRLDPADADGVEIAIDEIRLLEPGE